MEVMGIGGVQVPFNVVRGRDLITVADTDRSILEIFDFNHRTGAFVTTPLKAWEPDVIHLVNHNTAASSLIEFFDVDQRNAVTATGDPLFEVMLAAGETKTLTHEELAGLRFYLEVDAQASTATIFCYVSGRES